jgi:hypothetical protein
MCAALGAILAAVYALLAEFVSGLQAARRQPVPTPSAE